MAIVDSGTTYIRVRKITGEDLEYALRNPFQGSVFKNYRQSGQDCRFEMNMAFAICEPGVHWVFFNLEKDAKALASAVSLQTSFKTITIDISENALKKLIGEEKNKGSASHLHARAQLFRQTTSHIQNAFA